jgi:hypothetical protein
LDFSMNDGSRGSSVVVTQVPKISFSDLRHFTDMIHEHTGIRFGPRRFGAVRECLVKRMGDMGHASPGDYFAYALQPGNQGELKLAADLMVSGGSGA